ncbi:ABC transporter G family member 11 [Cyphellophora attinorum]|uniref:ABC transporter G family member 11 n=1 Tax=Cyphellophora attinorum TaxID=1664694 RepID=A0A0N0NRJ6_9EURO|nr:ABC transporter G family member 11 [Phialophora attinorum]KPI45158.1 ABC transporter G family member 11 [Phialophora attinorum]
MLGNRRSGYSSIEGDVWHGSMTHEEAEYYRGQIAMNTEEEIFYPALTVGQTIDFATRLKAPQHLPDGTADWSEYRRQTNDFLLDSMDITHTKATKVGDAFVRGVSGGERKRVSIIETLATRASVFCWDNSTRGLDASTALEYTKAIRSMTDEFGLASIVTLVTVPTERQISPGFEATYPSLRFRLIINLPSRPYKCPRLHEAV